MCRFAMRFIDSVKRTLYIGSRNVLIHEPFRKIYRVLTPWICKKSPLATTAGDSEQASFSVAQFPSENVQHFIDLPTSQPFLLRERFETKPLDPLLFCRRWPAFQFRHGLLFPEKQVHNPATSDVSIRLTAVSQDRLICAASIFESVGEDWKLVE